MAGRAGRLPDGSGMRDRVGIVSVKQNDHALVTSDIAGLNSVREEAHVLGTRAVVEFDDRRCGLIDGIVREVAAYRRGVRRPTALAAS